MENRPRCHDTGAPEERRAQDGRPAPVAFLVLALTAPLWSACGEERILDAPDPEPTIVEKLTALDGITVTELPPTNPPLRRFQIDMQQPVDHGDPTGGQFTQRMYLHHADETQPMVFAPSGYEASEWSLQELAVMLNGNCLSVTHRYWEGARPEPMDLQYLTIVQAAADHHAIVEKFKDIYTGLWVSSGASKSGGSAVYHRRHYPDDVAATVAYVTPFMLSDNDERFPPFLATIGSDEDRQRLRGFQRMVLERREALLPAFEAWFPENGRTLAWDANQSFESHVLEYESEFWQNRSGGTDEIPDEGASDQDILEHLNLVSPFKDSSEEEIIIETPSMYQHLSEIGFPAFERAHLEDLLITEPFDYSQAFWDFYGVTLTYDPDVMRDIRDWVVAEGDNIIFLYGGDDPWTAAAIELEGRTNAIRIINPGSRHGVRIDDLSSIDRARVIAALEQWLGIGIGM